MTEDQQVGRPRKLLPLKTLLLASLLVLGMTTATGLVVFFHTWHSTDDDPAVIIAKECSIGGHHDIESKVSVILGKYLGGISSGTKVSTNDVGAIIDRITPDDLGLAFYKVYTDCLKQQSAIFLYRQGVVLTSPSQQDTEAKQDEQTRERISNINPATPSQKLVEIFGAPIASGPDEYSDKMDLDIYQYKFSAWAFDYRTGGKRVGLILATKDPADGSSMLFDQIQGVNIGSVYKDCKNLVATAHYNARSGICPSSHLNNYVESIYFFYGIFTTQIKQEVTSDKCKASAEADHLPDPNLCPGYGSVPALAVAFVSNPSSQHSADRNLTRVADAYLEELDFGGTIAWLSPAESAAMQKLEGDEEKMNSVQLDAAIAAEKQHRAQRYQALVQASK